MRFQTKLVTLATAAPLAAAPAFALGHPGHKPTTPGPKASAPADAKAYGKLCQGESKKHAAGQKGTPFSKCVTDMAHLANGSTKNASVTCKNESKTHVAGQKGTPFSVCASGGKKLLKENS